MNFKSKTDLECFINEIIFTTQQVYIAFIFLIHLQSKNVDTIFFAWLSKINFLTHNLT